MFAVEVTCGVHDTSKAYNYGYQWRVIKKGTTTYYETDEPTFRYKVKDENDFGITVLCEVPDAYGNNKYTRDATVTQNTVFAITRQPEPNQTVSDGHYVILMVEAKGVTGIYRYQWQYFNNGIWMSFPNETNSSLMYIVYDSPNYPIRCKVDCVISGVLETLYTDTIIFTVN